MRSKLSHGLAVGLLLLGPVIAGCSKGRQVPLVCRLASERSAAVEIGVVLGQDRHDALIEVAGTVLREFDAVDWELLVDEDQGLTLVTIVVLMEAEKTVSLPRGEAPSADALAQSEEFSAALSTLVSQCVG